MPDPRGFMKWDRRDPEKRDPDARLGDYKEFVLPVSPQELTPQSGRCMDCGVAFCQSDYGCPVENLIPEWNELVFHDQWQDALSRLHLTNNFPEFTGKLCPAPCESACVLGIASSPVSIRSIESHIIERGFSEGWVKPQPATRSTGKRVAIVGSGPAGLAAAQELVRQGHAVTVYEKADEIGGLLRYGIPDFKLEKWVLDRRLEQLKAEGVHFLCGVQIGRDIPLSHLEKGYDAICLAVGCETPRDLPIPGRELDGILFAMDFLIHENRRQNSRLQGEFAFDSRLDARGKKVIIIGGGDTGSDCLGTVLRQGCSEVTQFEILEKPGLERSSQTPWPHWPLLLRTSHAHEEGGERRWSVLTSAFKGEQGKLIGVETCQIEWKNGESGRRFEKVGGSEVVLPADMVLLALGFEPAPVIDLGEKVSLNSGKSNDFGTSHLKVFTAGDARRGASLIVWAIAEGRKMAAAVHGFLS